MKVASNCSPRLSQRAMERWAINADHTAFSSDFAGGQPSKGEVSPCIPLETALAYNSATQVRWPTTSRTSQPSQALGACHASTGSVCRYCVSYSAAAWPSWTRCSRAPMVCFSVCLSRQEGMQTFVHVRAERQVSAAPESGRAADADRRRLHTLVRRLVTNFSGCPN